MTVKTVLRMLRHYLPFSLSFIDGAKAMVGKLLVYHESRHKVKLALIFSSLYTVRKKRKMPVSFVNALDEGVELLVLLSLNL